MRLLTVLALLATVGCTADSGERLPDSLLVDVMTALHLVEARAQLTDTTGIVPRRDSVFDVHGITEAQYRRSVEAYSHDMEGYLRVYDAVLSRLNELRLEEGRRAADTTAVD